MTKSNNAIDQGYFTIQSILAPEKIILELELDEENRFVVKITDSHVHMFREHRMSEERIDDIRIQQDTDWVDKASEEDLSALGEWQAHRDEGTSFPIENVSDVIAALQRVEKIKILL